MLKRGSSRAVLRRMIICPLCRDGDLSLGLRWWPGRPRWPRWFSSGARAAPRCAGAGGYEPLRSEWRLGVKRKRPPLIIRSNSWVYMSAPEFSFSSFGLEIDTSALTLKKKPFTLLNPQVCILCTFNVHLLQAMSKQRTIKMIYATLDWLLKSTLVHFIMRNTICRNTQLKQMSIIKFEISWHTSGVEA